MRSNCGTKDCIIATVAVDKGGLAVCVRLCVHRNYYAFAADVDREIGPCGAMQREDEQAEHTSVERVSPDLQFL